MLRSNSPVMPLEPVLQITRNSALEKAVAASQHVAKPNLAGFCHISSVKSLRQKTPQGKPVLPYHKPCEKLLHFLVRGLFTARIAKLPGLQAFGVFLLVFGRCVVAVLTVPALQRNDFPHT